MIRKDADRSLQEFVIDRVPMPPEEDFFVQDAAEPHLRDFCALSEINGRGAGFHTALHNVQKFHQIELLRRVRVVLSSEEEIEPEELIEPEEPEEEEPEEPEEEDEDNI